MEFIQSEAKELVKRPWQSKKKDKEKYFLTGMDGMKKKELASLKLFLLTAEDAEDKKTKMKNI